VLLCRDCLRCAAGISLSLVRAQNSATQLPPVEVEAPKQRAKPRQAANTNGTPTQRTARANRAPKSAAPAVANVADDGNGPNNNNSGPPLQQVPGGRQDRNQAC
jgi:iron complex outermembrane receptor protein